MNNIKENAEKKGKLGFFIKFSNYSLNIDDILEEKVTENILAIPKSSKKGKP